jgi:ATP-dependent helicase/nuclease subunit A
VTERLEDATERARIRADTAETLFVNAGAGSGKTTALIDRVTKLVLVDKVPLANIAAVTFTERAGAELRDRLRARFETTWRDDHDDEEKQAAQEALDDLDSAAIGTLHAFAQRLLLEHPIEARLPPLIEVLDEVGSSVAFEDRWSELQTALLDDDAMAEPLLIGMSLGMTMKHIRSLAQSLGSDWDLISDRVMPFPLEPVQVPDLTSFLDQAATVAALADSCTDDNDKLFANFPTLKETAALLPATGDVESQLNLLCIVKKLKFSNGRKANWTIPCQQIRDAANALAASAGGVVGGVLDQCLRHMTRWVAERVLEAAEARRQEGRLEFHDLLVLARNLLRHNPAARAALHDSYRRLLLDEFQDTDPIQIELAVRIAGGEHADQEHWQDVTVPPGRLFVVGDAKQSIYRFRRASIATYLAAQSIIGSPAELSTNFRTVKPILDWVNAVFGELIQYEADGQPAYEPLACHRRGTGEGPAVTVVGATPHADLPRAAATVLRAREASDVADVIRQAIDESWQVYDEKAKKWRAAEHKDIAVLVPARTSLAYLEEALDRSGVPYRAEASSLVYQAVEVRDLLACARAIADSSDELSLVTALRSPLFGCGDDDLWRWKQAGGRFTVYSELNDADPLGGGPVGSALAYLRRLSFEARWRTPSELLGRIVADRRMLEVAAVGPRMRDSWRRLRFVVDQARAWSEASHGGLRAYLAWAAFQGQELSRVAEAVLPETDTNSVRVMTIHAAKGLEFPIVILSGMTAQAHGARGVQLLWPGVGGYSVKLGAGIQTADFEAALPIDEQMDKLEKLRLLYVATTRARDHLVVSLHRSGTSNAVTAAKLMADAGGATVANPTQFASSADDVPPTVTAQSIAPPPPAYIDWFTGVEAARKRSRVHAAISASGLEGTEPAVILAEPDDAEAGRAKGPRDLELPPWSKGRYGSAIGRAVHAVLQVIDLGTGDGLDQAVAAQSVAEGLVGNEDLIRSVVQSALDSEVVKRAAASQHWRETYVGTVQDDGTILEGYVDLIFREIDGSLTVVDYKTDAVPAGAIPSRVAYYKPQMDAYRECLTASTGGEVSTTLLFLQPSTASAVRVV